jgi:uncharacterized membrane protein
LYINSTFDASFAGHQNIKIMLQINWLAVILSGLIPMAVGAIWYGPLLGKIWQRETGISDETIKGSNMAMIYGMSTLFAIIFAVGVMPYVIHQFHIGPSLMNQGVMEDGSEAKLFAADYLMKYGKEFRLFSHGALHGMILGLFVLLPVIGTNALFERKSWKYILINAGYWAISAALVGGVICAFA